MVTSRDFASRQHFSLGDGPVLECVGYIFCVCVTVRKGQQSVYCC